jgi:hypothetical protein
MFELPHGRLSRQFPNGTAAIRFLSDMDQDATVADGLLMSAGQPLIYLVLGPHTNEAGNASGNPLARTALPTRCRHVVDKDQQGAMWAGEVARMGHQSR